MKQLSYCHKAPIKRHRFTWKHICSSCGMYVSITKQKKFEEIIEKEKEIIWFPEDKKEFVTEIFPDDRKMIIHLDWRPNKYTACGTKGFRTTGISRVNCKICMRTELYKKLSDKKHIWDTQSFIIKSDLKKSENSNELPVQQENLK